MSALRLRISALVVLSAACALALAILYTGAGLPRGGAGLPERITPASAPELHGGPD